MVSSLVDNENGNVSNNELNIYHKMVSMPDIEPSTDQVSESMVSVQEEPKQGEKKKDCQPIEGYVLQKSNSDIPGVPS